MNRDEYVQQLKAQIDQWNAQMAKWESASQEFRNKYLQQLDELQVRRDEALAQLRRVQNASGDAWQEMMRGADAALKSLQDAFERARQQFGRK
jgi:predicted translin family RNA/ssDNA-binding protein